MTRGNGVELTDKKDGGRRESVTNVVHTLTYRASADCGVKLLYLIVSYRGVKMSSNKQDRSKALLMMLFDWISSKDANYDQITYRVIRGH